MPDVICNTSPIQYLHQLQLLSILPALVSRVIVPPAVIDELGEGRNLGINLPELDSFVVVACPDTEIGFSWGRVGIVLDLC